MPPDLSLGPGITLSPGPRVAAPTAPFFDVDVELRRIALAGAVRTLPAGRLADALSRARVYAAAGLTAWSGDDDAEAQRRALLFLVHVAAPPVVAREAAA